jgi:hypothetical protein
LDKEKLADLVSNIITESSKILEKGSDFLVQINATLPYISEIISETSEYAVKTSNHIIENGDSIAKEASNKVIESCMENPLAVVVGSLGIAIIINNLSKPTGFSSKSLTSKGIHLVSAAVSSVALVTLENSVDLMKHISSASTMLSAALPHTSRTICNVPKSRIDLVHPNDIDCRLVDSIDYAVIFANSAYFLTIAAISYSFFTTLKRLHSASRPLNPIQNIAQVRA